MSDFNKIKIKPPLDCDCVHEQENEELISDYWDWDDWNKLTDTQKETWLEEFRLEWKSNCEGGGVWLEGGDGDNKLLPKEDLVKEGLVKGEED